MRPAKLKDQLLCLVVPLGSRVPREVADQLRAARAKLDALFCAHGGIHYATFTLLPPSPQGTEDPSGPALALMLAVDAGASPTTTLKRLIALDAQTLQDIYAAPVAPGGTVPEALGAVLLARANLQALTGGFVAARDRSVAQIQAEGRLARHLRARAATKPPAARGDARRLAAELAAEAFRDPRFSWAREAAPQGAWRAKVTPAWLRLGASAGWLVGLGYFVLLVSALAMIGFANKLAVAALNDSFVHLSDTSLTFTKVYREDGPLGMWLRGLAILLLVVNGIVIILVRQRLLPLAVLEVVLSLSGIAALGVLPGVAGLALSNAFSAVPSDLQFARTHLVYGLWVVMGLLALAGILLGSAAATLRYVPPYLPERWLVIVGVAVFAIGLVALHYVLAGLVGLAHHFQWPGKQWYQGTDAWGWQPIDRIAIVVLVVAVVAYAAYRFLYAFLEGVGEVLERLNLPTPDSPEHANRRLHQTAPSITACEAEWIGRTAVMVSLTEVRRPYFWRGGWADIFLRMISSLGWHYYSEGKLGGVSSIHHAHWHLIDKGRRLLFCSNFDGDFGGYLDEFILGKVPLLNVIWRWTHLGNRPPLPLGGPEFDAAPTRERRYPATRLLLFSGCRREQQFKAYARESMLPFQYHFAAYDFPVADIVRSTLLRDALGAPRTPTNDALVMRALEA